MNRRNSLIFISVLFFLFVIAVFVVLFVQQSGQKTQKTAQLPSEKFIFSTPTAEISPIPTVAALSPFDVTNNFYTWYISYKGDPLTTGAYKTSDYLSDSYKNKIADLISGNVKDPIFCSANIIADFGISRTYYNAQMDQAAVNILKYNGDGKSIYAVNLQKIDNRWLITDIACIPNQ